MAQVVVWARREHLDRHRSALSDAIHGAVMAALDYPPDKNGPPTSSRPSRRRLSTGVPTWFDAFR